MKIPEELNPWFHNHILPDGTRTIPYSIPEPSFGYENPKPLCDRVCQLLGDVRGKTILDVGCNSGYFMFELMSRGASLTGIDISKLSIDQLKFVASARGIEVDCDDVSLEQFINETDLRDDAVLQYDIVLLIGVLYHSTNPMNLLSLAMRMSKGVVIVETDTSSMEGSVIEFMNYKDVRENTSLPTIGAVRKMCEMLGLRIVSEDFWSGKRCLLRLEF